MNKLEINQMIERYLSSLSPSRRATVEEELGINLLYPNQTIRDIIDQNEEIREKVMSFLLRESFKAQAYQLQQSNFAERNIALKERLKAEEDDTSETSSKVESKQKKFKWLFFIAIFLLGFLIYEIWIKTPDMQKITEPYLKTIQAALKDSSNVLDKEMIQLQGRIDATQREIQSTQKKVANSESTEKIAANIDPDDIAAGHARNSKTPVSDKEFNNTNINAQLDSLRKQQDNLTFQNVVFKQKKSALDSLQKGLKHLESKQYLFAESIFQTLIRQNQWMTTSEFALLLTYLESEKNWSDPDVKSLITIIQTQHGHPYKRQAEELSKRIR